MIHVAIDAQLLSSEASYRGAGVSSYSRNLLSRLGSLAAALSGAAPRHRVYPRC